MSKEKEKIIELCSSPLTGELLIKALEKEIANMRPYDHGNRSGLESVGLEKPIRIITESEGEFSNCVEAIEDAATKRELAVAVAKHYVQVRVEGLNGERIPGKLAELLAKLAKDGGPNSKDSNECKEEDDSECWKCKKKPSCTKFKGFNLN